MELVTDSLVISLTGPIPFTVLNSVAWVMEETLSAGLAKYALWFCLMQMALPPDHSTGNELMDRLTLRQLAEIFAVKTAIVFFLECVRDVWWNGFASQYDLIATAYVLVLLALGDMAGDVISLRDAEKRNRVSAAIVCALVAALAPWCSESFELIAISGIMWQDAFLFVGEFRSQKYFSRRSFEVSEEMIRSFVEVPTKVSLAVVVLRFVINYLV